MVLLVVQLARFGDIYQTWPTLKALRRRSPGANIHLLVRERFVEATAGFEEFGVTVHAFPAAGILRPVFERGEDGLGQAAGELESFLQNIKSLQPDRIINLSFSPLSSYLVDELSGDNTEVTGYTRHADGFLKIPDDTSAYFYAQVGVGRHNRYHICDVLAAVAGVDLMPEDFDHPLRGLPRGSSIVVHLGASQGDKTYPAELWVRVLEEVLPKVDGSFILVGSSAERPVAEYVAGRLADERIVNRVGQSSLSELCHWVSQARLVIGADSAPMQIASLMGTPALNLSCAAVNFWETGPLTPSSIVLYHENIGEIPPGRVAAAARALCRGEIWSDSAAYIVQRGREKGFEWVNGRAADEFHWKLLQALYTQADYPALEDGASPLGFQRLFEVTQLALENLEQWRKSGPSSTIRQILESVDEMLVAIAEMDDRVKLVVDWFQTERLRMGPDQPEVILARTCELFEQLALVSSVYHRGRSPSEAAQNILELARLCVPKLREFDFAAAESDFQKLLSILQILANVPTKVGVARPWSSVLGGLADALRRRDFVEMADVLEYDLPRRLAEDGALSETKAQDVII